MIPINNLTLNFDIVRMMCNTMPLCQFDIEEALKHAILFWKVGDFHAGSAQPVQPAVCLCSVLVVADSQALHDCGHGRMISRAFILQTVLRVILSEGGVQAAA